jgi:hypothetical protein
MLTEANASLSVEAADGSGLSAQSPEPLERVLLLRVLTVLEKLFNR